MQITIIKKNKIIINDFSLEGKSNYWIEDTDNKGNSYNMIYITTQGREWVVCSNDYASLMADDIELASEKLLLNKIYKVKSIFWDDIILFYLSNAGDASFKCYELVNESEITIGRGHDNVIQLNNSIINEKEMSMFYKNGTWSYETVKTDYPIFRNRTIAKSGTVVNGDVFTILGFKIVVFNKFLYINNFNNSLIVNNDYFISKVGKTNYEIIDFAEENDSLTAFDESDYFARSPRFKTTIIEETIKLTEPPKLEGNATANMLLNMVPRMLMGATSILTAYTAITAISSGEKTVKECLPSLLMSGSMIVSMFLWPTIMNAINSRKRKKANKVRVQKYTQYIEEKRKKIEFLKTSQRQVLNESYLSPEECQNIIFYKKRNLWERKIENDDFLNIRLGIGTVPLIVALDYEPEDFSLEDDDLRKMADELAQNSTSIDNCPIRYSITENNKTVVIGDEKKSWEFINNIILQLCTFQNYEDLKIVFMVDDNSKKWDCFKQLPHVWDNSKTNRFFSSTLDEMNKISFLLEQVHKTRKYNEDEVTLNEKKDFKNFSPYYVIITDCIENSKNIPIISKVMSDKMNYGFSVVILNDGLSNLPNECNNYIMINDTQSAVISSDLNTSKQTGFITDVITSVDLSKCFEKLASIPMKLSSSSENMKTNVGFLEMFKVGRVEQLNCLVRWKDNNPTNSLATEIGLHANNDLFYLDLHEKYHGPHGLIAGTTGSGKSEFIITYILSLAVNYHPYEVQFVLIDYKGGGLAGAFENKETGVKLPHLIGSITNLDTIEMNRSLASIKSELKRRQTMFNDAKTKLNESTIDIYKYQRLYRDGKLDKPMSHLFIISDEFAELKSQQPEFMDQLISTARIGRSLGVHLILATQKPAGVVNDQIWSNSKFKVCLKVQDKSDSNDVIKRPDAAELKNAGRFYLQIGYNEYFALGQSAYCGGAYYPTDKIKKKIDRKLSMVNNIGNIVKNLEWDKTEIIEPMGEEITNILKYINDSATTQKIECNKLWLDRIPNVILVEDIAKKYGYSQTKYHIEPIIGEYDAPDYQQQHMLTINLDNNTIIYGSPGNGKELMLSSILFSTILYHLPEEVLFYILDFGSETLKCFSKMPHIGDIIMPSDEEKLTNLFKMLNNEFGKRKQAFADYNGDYNYYIDKNQNKLPRIVVIINGFDNFSESHEKYVDELNILSREALRYGIAFIVAVNNQNVIKMKTSQNFEQKLVLRLNNSEEYSFILGKTNGIVPSDTFGRGIVQIDKDTFEFQTAYPCEWENISEYIKALSASITSQIHYEQKKIAILPKVVNREQIKDYICTLDKIPIGISKDSLQVEYMDLLNNNLQTICCEDISETVPFLLSLSDLLCDYSNTTVTIVDYGKVLEDYTINPKINYLKKMEDLVVENNNETNIYILTNTLMSLNDGEKEILELFNNKFEVLNDSDKVKLILIDQPKSLRNISSISPIQRIFKDSNYLWIGPGIENQFTLKNNVNSRVAALTYDFAYKVTKGKADPIKYINFYDKGDDNNGQ